MEEPETWRGRRISWPRRAHRRRPHGAFYDTLAKHYGVSWGYRGDPRVIFYVKIERVVGQNL